MAWQDSDISGGKVRLKHSPTAAETIAADGLVPGEVAINTADGKLYYKSASGVLSIPGVKVATLTYAATVTTNAASGDIFDLTLTGNVTLANPTNGVNGQTIRWRIRQDATGSRTITLGNKFQIPSSATTPLAWSTAANAMDILAATYHAGRDKWDVVALVTGY
jgi:hypothetical protein